MSVEQYLLHGSSSNRVPVISAQPFNQTSAYNSGLKGFSFAGYAYASWGIEARDNTGDWYTVVDYQQGDPFHSFDTLKERTIRGFFRGFQKELLYTSEQQYRITPSVSAIPTITITADINSWPAYEFDFLGEVGAWALEARLAGTTDDMTVVDVGIDPDIVADFTLPTGSSYEAILRMSSPMGALVIISGLEYFSNETPVPITEPDPSPVPQGNQWADTTVEWHGPAEKIVIHLTEAGTSSPTHFYGEIDLSPGDRSYTFGVSPSLFDANDDIVTTTVGWDSTIQLRNNGISNIAFYDQIHYRFL